jgi:hypothetical protein
MKIKLEILTTKKREHKAEIKLLISVVTYEVWDPVS